MLLSMEEKTLYLYRNDESSCISHDGHIQLGYFNHSIEKHIELNPLVRWVETYWKPDVFGVRYLRAGFQAHQRVSGEKSVLESNQADTRLNRSV